LFQRSRKSEKTKNACEGAVYLASQALSEKELLIFAIRNEYRKAKGKLKSKANFYQHQLRQSIEAITSTGSAHSTITLG